MKNQIISLGLSLGLFSILATQGFAAEATGSLSTTSGSINASLTGQVSQVITAAALPTVATISGSTTSASSVTVNSGSSIAFNPTGNVRVTIPASTVITSSTGGLFDTTAIAAAPVVVSSGLASDETSAGAIEFGISNVGLHFSRPIRVDIPVPTVTATAISVKVRHGGTAVFVTSGLTNNPNATCTGGLPSIVSNIATVTSGIATIYTCSASTFATVQPASSTLGGGGAGATNAIVSLANIPLNNGKVPLNNFASGAVVVQSGSLISDETTDIVRFIDISKNWSRSNIEKLAVLGIVNNTDRFYPERNLTRAEFVKMIVNTLGLDLDLGNDFAGFDDVSTGYTLARYIAVAGSQKLINTTNRDFRPDDTITRAEAMKILVLALDVDTPSIEGSSFDDVDTRSDLARYIESAQSLKIVSGQYIGSKLMFRPNDSVTRAEIAKILVNGFGL